MDSSTQPGQRWDGSRKFSGGNGSRGLQIGLLVQRRGELPDGVHALDGLQHRQCAGGGRAPRSLSSARGRRGGAQGHHRRRPAGGKWRRPWAAGLRSERRCPRFWTGTGRRRAKVAGGGGVGKLGGALELHPSMAAACREQERRKEKKWRQGTAARGACWLRASACRRRRADEASRRRRLAGSKGGGTPPAGLDCVFIFEPGGCMSMFFQVSSLQSGSTCQKMIKRPKSSDECFL